MQKIFSGERMAVMEKAATLLAQGWKVILVNTVVAPIVKTNEGCIMKEHPFRENFGNEMYLTVVIEKPDEVSSSESSTIV